MEKFTGQALTWTRQPCEIKDGRIWRIIGAPIETYNVIDFCGYAGQPPLYSTFASIDETNQASIIEFCNRFGLLGLIHSKAFRNRKDRIDRANIMARKNGTLKEAENLPLEAEEQRLVDSLEEEERDENSESIEDIKIEILRMRSIMETFNAINSMNSELLQLNIGRARYLGEIGFSLSGYYDKDIVRIDEANPYQYARKEIANVINEYLGDISPVIEFDYYANRYGRGWRVDSLIATMYLMLYFEIGKGKSFTHCQNETCNKFFPVELDKLGTKYCGQYCARAQASREYRRREKDKKSNQ